MRKPFGPVVGLLLPFVFLAAEPWAPPTESPPFTAADGEDLARTEAAAWAEDAQLIYLENDALVNRDGSSARWGYLYYSVRAKKARGYSVEDGTIRIAEDLPFDFPAPPITATWIDSGQALAAADEKAGLQFRTNERGTLRAMLLARGMLDPADPDATAWAVVYDSPGAPALWVVVNATSGKVVRTWRG